LAQPDQELSLATPDLERRHARPQTKPLDLIVPDLIEKAQEPGREGLGLLVSRRVPVERRIEPDVTDEPAPAAETQLDVSPRKRQRLLPGGEHQAAVRRHALHAIEDLNVAAAAGVAGEGSLCSRQRPAPEPER